MDIDNVAAIVNVRNVLLVEDINVVRYQAVCNSAWPNDTIIKHWQSFFISPYQLLATQPADGNGRWHRGVQIFHSAGQAGERE